MGYLKDVHGMTLLGRIPEGTCPECAVVHDPDQPHNQQSLAYQYKFYNKNGRWVTWTDAMEHCSPDVKKFWIEQLGKAGGMIGNRDGLKEFGVEVE